MSWGSEALAGRAGSRPKRGYADGPYGQVHFHDGGAGAPVLLLHQAPLESRQFEAAMPRLSERGLRPIAVDLPGYGRSDPPAAEPTIADYACAVPAVLDHLQLERAHVVGHHTGALVATELALAHPARVERLILNGPLPLSDDERAMFLRDVEVREKGFAVRADGRHLSELFAGRAAYSAGSPGLDRINDYIVWMLSGSAPFWYGHHAACTYDHTPRLLALSHPTLILTNAGDAIFEHARGAQALRPDWPLVVLPGGGIDIPDQAPAAWADAVADFLTGPALSPA